MRRFITRHGQVPEGTVYNGGHLFPDGETLISELGARQAHLVGARLREIGFSGVILSSPYVRTLLTAEIIAEETGAEIVPFAPVHEIFRREKQIEEYKGLTAEEIKAKFKHIAEDFELEYPWWPSELEDMEAVAKRVERGVAVAEARYPDREILYVGHGASCSGLRRAYGIKESSYLPFFNCALSYVDDTGEKVKRVHCDTSYIPYEITTSNHMSRADMDVAIMSAEYTEPIALPEWATSGKARRLLHISDTASWHYPYYRRLIELVRPRVLIHTGDMADEVKVGRIEGVKDEYLAKVSVMCDVLRQSGAERLIVVPGNNDLFDEISVRLQGSEVYRENKQIEIDGRECRVGHSVRHMTFDKRWHFYGHGKTGESWEYASNTKEGECRFNATFGSTVINLDTGEFYRIALPEQDA